MAKHYCTVPLLILMCLIAPSSAQRCTKGIPTSCSTNGTTGTQQLPGWEYRGCYVDQNNTRLLQNYFHAAENMTPTSCASICSSQGYPYFGLEFSFQCFCGNILNTTAVPVDPSNCNYACCADSSVACGGCWYSSIYRSNETNNGELAPTQTPNVPNHSGNNSTNATSYGSDNSQTSNNIALGTGIGIGVPGVVLSAVLVIMKFSKRRHIPEQNGFRQSSETSSTPSLDTEPASPS